MFCQHRGNKMEMNGEFYCAKPSCGRRESDKRSAVLTAICFVSLTVLMVAFVWTANQ